MSPLLINERRILQLRRVCCSTIEETPVVIISLGENLLEMRNKLQAVFCDARDGVFAERSGGGLRCGLVCWCVGVLLVGQNGQQQLR